MRLEFREGVVFRDEPEGGILFDVDTGGLRLVEGVAWGIAGMIAAGTTREEVLAELERRYPEREELAGDLDSFLAELSSAGFLRN